MIYSQHFFIGSEFKGTATRYYPEFHKSLFEGQPYDVHSHAWFCQTCGEVWARTILENQVTGEQYPYQLRLHGCRNHPDPLHRTAPGSIRSWLYELLPILPDEMVRYEFNVLMKYLEESEDHE